MTLNDQDMTLNYLEHCIHKSWTQHDTNMTNHMSNHMTKLSTNMTPTLIKTQNSFFSTPHTPPIKTRIRRTV
jgi:hypothetical protein